MRFGRKKDKEEAFDAGVPEEETPVDEETSESESEVTAETETTEQEAPAEKIDAGIYADNDSIREGRCKYEPPKLLGQIIACMRLQFRQFSKQNKAVALIFLIAMVPLGIYAIQRVGLAATLIGEPFSVNDYLSYILCLMPIMTAMLSAYLCGSMLPKEFHERTAFLILPLPVSRLSFYIGKFLCGLILTEMTVVCVYGAALAMALMYIPTFYLEPFLRSMLVAMAAVFFMCSYTYKSSANSKKGSGFGCFLLMTLGIPILLLIVFYGLLQGMSFALDAGIIPETEDNLTNFLYGYFGITGYIPIFLPDMAITTMGPGMSIPFVSVNGGLYAILRGKAYFGIGNNPMISSIVAVVWGFLCLYRGYRRIARRDV